MKKELYVIGSGKGKERRDKRRIRRVNVRFSRKPGSKCSGFWGSGFCVLSFESIVNWLRSMEG